MPKCASQHVHFLHNRAAGWNWREMFEKYFALFFLRLPLMKLRDVKSVKNLGIHSSWLHKYLVPESSRFVRNETHLKGPLLLVKVPFISNPFYFSSSPALSSCCITRTHTSDKIWTESSGLYVEQFSTGLVYQIDLSVLCFGEFILQEFWTYFQSNCILSRAQISHFWCMWNGQTKE